MAGETTSRLTIAARALGMEDSAKSVDLLAAAQSRLAESQKELETAKTSGTVGDVAKLTAEQRDLRLVVDELSPAQDQLNAKTQDYIGLLTRVHPALGQFAQAGVRAVRVASELSTENVNLTKVFTGLKESITQNIGALGLLGAGAALFAGVSAVGGAWARLKRDADEATEALKKQVEAFNDLRRARDDQQTSIEQLSDRRREGGLSADQAAKARAAAESIGKRFGSALDPKSIDEAAAMLAGEGLSEDQLAQAAFSLQRGTLTLDPRRSAGARRKAFERASKRDQAAFEQFSQREAEQRAQSSAAAQVQANNGADASTVDVEGFINELPGGFANGEDVALLAQIVRAIRGRSAADVKLGGIIGDNLPGNQIADALRGQGTGFVNLEALASILEGEGIKARPEQIRSAEFVAQQLAKRDRGGSTVIVNNNQNSKNIVPGADAQRRARNNGESAASQAELGSR